MAPAASRVQMLLLLLYLLCFEYGKLQTGPPPDRLRDRDTERERERETGTDVATDLVDARFRLNIV